ncbi:MAG: hypothetical protein JNK65_00850 [Deltaproteobacteria bacterium]|nr:hypothetical protein [Deltaproteobacteria bacterium]
MSSPINIRFLQQLPESFIESNPTLRTLREIDQDHNFNISSDEIEYHALQEIQSIPSTSPQTRDQILNNLSASVERFHQLLSTTARRLTFASQRNGSFSLESAYRTEADQRSENQRNVIACDLDQNRRIDASEFALSLRLGRDENVSDFETLFRLLRQTDSTLYQTESNHQNDALPSLLHYVSYPRRWIWGQTWREGIQEVAEQRHLRRMDAIRHFATVYESNPNRPFSDVLSTLESGGNESILNLFYPEYETVTAETLREDARILREDLQIGSIINIADARTAETRGTALLNMAQTLRDGAWNTTRVGDRFSGILGLGAGSISEWAALPWRNNNFIMARSLLQAVQDSDSMTQSARAQARNAYTDSIGNGRGFFSNVLNPFHWRENWSDESSSLNTIFSETAALGIELYATRGLFRGLGAGGSWAWRYTGARVAAGLAQRGWLRTAALLGHPVEVAATEATATAAVAETATATARRSALRTLAGNVIRVGGLPLEYTGRAVRAVSQGITGSPSGTFLSVLNVGTYAAMVNAEHDFLRPPGREVDFEHLDYSVRAEAPSEQGPVGTPLSQENLNTLVSMNFVSLEIQSIESEMNATQTDLPNR